MQHNEIAGYAAIVIGVLLLLFTFYQAYMLFINPFANIGDFSGYINVNTAHQAYPPSSSNLSTSSLESGIASSLAASLISSIPLNAYFFVIIEVLLLFVFASIGYKFTRLGLDLIIRHPSHKSDKAQK